MALITCPECGKEISDKALTCPNCGCPIKQEEKSEEYLYCPKCGSRDLHADKKGFSGGKALAGAVVAGGIGLLAGTIGSRDVDLTCLKCGHRFKAGEAKVFKSDDLKKDLDSRIIETLVSGSVSDAAKLYSREMNVSELEALNYIKPIAANIRELATPEQLERLKENIKDSRNSGCAVTIIAVISTIMACASVLF